MKSKIMRIIVDLVLIGLGIVFLVFGIKDLMIKIEETKTPDNIKFAKTYTNVGSDNDFTYVNNASVENGIVFVGDKNDVWSLVLAPVLNRLIKDKSVSKYYYEVNSDTPVIIVRKDNESVLELNKEDLYESDFDGIPIEYWTDDRINELNDKLSEYID